MSSGQDWAAEMQTLLGHRSTACVESTGEKPTDDERSLACIETALVEIKEQANAALLALEELKQSA